MDQHKKIEIKSNNTRRVVILLIMLLLIYKIFAQLIDEFSDNHFFSMEKVFSTAILLSIACIFGYLALIVAKQLLDKEPGLIIKKEGITDHSGVVSAGVINWADVFEVNNNKILFSDCIELKVKNPLNYISKQPDLFKRTWLKLENRYAGSPVNISAGNLKIKHKDLFSIVQKYYLMAQVDVRTGDLQREKEVIQQEKAELLDSIKYAKRIQTSLLPSVTTLELLLGDCFILNLPKDIVSGDFYWVNTVDEWVFFAVCDCTGHGVPGALISIVCNNALNRAVKEFGIIQPAQILHQVAELVIESIGTDPEVKDGMDASILAFNKSSRELFWAGANIPLWIAREDTFYELLEFRPDKQPIGSHENRVPYTNHKIDIKKGDILYLFSDGYADQFGGELGKKMTRKKFKELLLLQRGKSLSEQRANLLRYHMDFKGSTGQIDDILVAGIRIEL